jgi:1-acyl-sn-glycerol-3-phosphate acyltransferase
MSWQSKSASPPPGYRYGRRYRASWENVIRAIIYIARGKPRSLAQDALLAIPNMPAPPLIRHADRIPESGQCVVVANHYERPGLWMAWPAIFAGHAVRERTGKDVHWVAIEEWESFSLWGIAVPPGVVKVVFERAFQTYGILAMPSPHAPATARAGAMRAAVQEIKEGHIIGLMPEGDVGATPELLEAREGVGAFLLLLAGRAPLLPVGLYEENDRLVADFGSPFPLELPAEVPKNDRDRWVRDRVMRAIRDLLPEPLWGIYRTQA